LDPHAAGTMIGYCTDVEGNYEYWQRYLLISHVLSNENNAIVLKKNCQFVYGGDVCDRGAGDIRVLDDLIRLYESYPGRVHFILGNRDVNKLRIPMELHEKYLAQPGAAYWIPADPEQGPQTISERLKWVLKKTMGAPETFEHRRKELEILGRATTDDDVVQSFFDMLIPDGTLMKYLKYGKISVQFGDLLFCHGGLTTENFGWIPPSTPNSAPSPNADSFIPGVLGGSKCEDFSMWKEELNRFVSTEVEDFNIRAPKYLRELNKITDLSTLPPHWGLVGTYTHDQPGSRLSFLGMAVAADQTPNPSAIYASYMNQGMPKDITKDFADKLLGAGVKRIVVGHQPHGDAPTILDQYGVQIFMGDTSYAANTQWPQAAEGETEKWAAFDIEKLSDPALGVAELPMLKGDTRGCAVSEIVITFPESDVSTAPAASSRVFVHGILSDASVYAFEQAPSEGNALVGKLNASKTWMIKACNVAPKTGPLAGQTDCYLLCQGVGFKVINKIVSAAEIEKVMAE
jgi:hypothetical protein